MMVQLVLFPDEFPYHFFLSRETNPHMFNKNSVWLDSFVNMGFKLFIPQSKRLCIYADSFIPSLNNKVLLIAIEMLHAYLSGIN